MKLWLDDVRPAPAGWTHVRSVAEAIITIGIDVIEDGAIFEAASLDHDLGNGTDGIVFVDWMIENNIWPRTKPLVHSMNPPGRERMERSINRYFPEE
jgi:hypothetical protein